MYYNVFCDFAIYNIPFRTFDPWYYMEDLSSSRCI